tara:strand:- start:20 stop:478 length:459 start_codon:yes stop_codon:yes gene_type:complete
MSISFGPISVTSTGVSGLSVYIENTDVLGKTKTATFSWDDTLIDGSHPEKWRVIINNYKTYLVYTNPIFSLSLPEAIFDKCTTCVKVQAIYPNGITTNYSNELCVKNIPQKYCRNKLSHHPANKKAKISSFKGSHILRHARAIRMGGKNAFR